MLQVRKNRSVSNDSLVMDGTVIADEFGLITVEGISVSAEENRLIIEPGQ